MHGSVLAWWPGGEPGTRIIWLQVDAVDRNGMTAVHLAAEFGQCDAIGILVRKERDALHADTAVLYFWNLKTV